MENVIDYLASDGSYGLFSLTGVNALQFAPKGQIIEALNQPRSEANLTVIFENKKEYFNAELAEGLFKNYLRWKEQYFAEDDNEREADPVDFD
jgi:hypothetical protein